MMLGGQSKQYRNMYERFVEVAKEHLFFRPMTIGNKDILLSGTVKKTANGVARFSPDVEHLSCFTGGMLAIAGKIFNRPDDVTQGRKLADGCVWAYQNTISGIMPEAFTAVPCENKSYCCWNEKAWYDAVDPVSDPGTVRWGINSERLSPGFAKVKDKRYLLRFVPLLLIPVFPFRGLWILAPKPSNPSSSSTESQAMSTGVREVGICSRPSAHIPRRSSPIQLSTTCWFLLQESWMRWNRSGLRRR